MKNYRKFMVVLCVIVILCTMAMALIGCEKEEDNYDDNFDVSMPMPQLAYKSNQTTFDINDVTLTFYCGSNNAGSSNYFDIVCPIVTYIYFANSKAYKRIGLNNNDIVFDYVEQYHPNKLYGTIETNENFSVCKKIYSTDEDAFYKNNTVKLLYTDVPYKVNTYAAEDEWGKGSALYKASISYTRGVYIPDVSYVFTIPQQFFTEEQGYVFFCMASYIMEDGESANGSSWQEGSQLEHRELAIYYTRNGANITLSSKYR